jgi:hypothetical protein
VRTLRHVGVSLVIIGVLWIAPLLIVQVYAEPGNGSIGCGRVWRAERTEGFIQASCHRAIEHRRAGLLYPPS